MSYMLCSLYDKKMSLRASVQWAPGGRFVYEVTKPSRRVPTVIEPTTPGDEMRLASYNVENLFNRAKAMNLGNWAEGKPVLDNFAKLSALSGEHAYSASARRRMVELLRALGLEKSGTGPFVMLRQNRGDLVKRPRRAAWRSWPKDAPIGWALWS